MESIFLSYLVLQSNEVTSSNAMEKEGLIRGLASLQEKGIEIETLVTDRHASVAKWLQENHPDIKHKYDVWHIAKGNSFIYASVRFQKTIYRIQLCLSFVIHVWYGEHQLFLICRKSFNMDAMN